jgi:hypothetical protein
MANCFINPPSAGCRQAGIATRVRQRRKKEKKRFAPNISKSNQSEKKKSPWNDRFMIGSEGAGYSSNTSVDRNKSRSPCKQKNEFSANSHCDGLTSYTERANGSPQVITYGKVKESDSNATMISRSCSPMDLKIVTKALEESKISEQMKGVPSSILNKERLDLEEARRELDQMGSTKAALGFPSPAEVER